MPRRTRAASGDRPAPPAPERPAPEPQVAATAPPVSDQDIAEGAMASFGAERDGLLARATPLSLLPEDEDALADRDPFSADYLGLMQERMIARAAPGRRVDERLRADLLERPHLLPRPEESAQRGAAAVWRSLRAQLTQDTTALPDSSHPEELRMLWREFESQKLLVDSVSRGIDGLLRRIEQRLAEAGTTVGAVAAEPRPPGAEGEDR